MFFKCCEIIAKALSSDLEPLNLSVISVSLRSLDTWASIWRFSDLFASGSIKKTIKSTWLLSKASKSNPSESIVTIQEGFVICSFWICGIAIPFPIVVDPIFSLLMRLFGHRSDLIFNGYYGAYENIYFSTFL